jgi:hypothetical protein
MNHGAREGGGASLGPPSPPPPLPHQASEKTEFDWTIPICLSFCNQEIENAVKICRIFKYFWRVRMVLQALYVFIHFLIREVEVR